MTIPTNYIGTAKYYSEFRPRYPDGFLQEIISAYSLNNKGRLVDLGCGPGILSLPLAPYFKEVLALDTENEMLEEGEYQAKQAAINNIKWINLPAENVGELDGNFRLAVMGNSFLWMDRQLVLQSLFRKIELHQSGIVMIQRRSFWEGNEPWRVHILALIKKWLGSNRRTSSGLFNQPLAGHVDVFRQFQFSDIQERVFKQQIIWSASSMLGYLYSNTFSSRNLFGNHLIDFEKDFFSLWPTISEQEVVHEEIHYDAIFAWR